MTHTKKPSVETRDKFPSRVVIDTVRPQVDGGQFPVKRVVGDFFEVRAVLLCDGHDELKGRLFFRHEDESSWQTVSLKPTVNDIWTAGFRTKKLGRYYYTVDACVDRWGSWVHDAYKKAAAGTLTPVDVDEGLRLLERERQRCDADDGEYLTAKINQLARLKEQGLTAEDLREWESDERFHHFTRPILDETSHVTFEEDLVVEVDSEKAGFSAWYEFFPRSTGSVGDDGVQRHGTFRDCEERLDYVSWMGFDVVYLPPIHPIGESFRKGRNNSLEAGDDDVGSPWAIGSKDGGHKSIHPKLGTFEDFERFVEKARSLNIDVALDIAFQCSPDHPYVREHPEWFHHRADGTIQYAENPPKKYQDIYPLNFECENWKELWQELKSVFLFWAEKGVKIFRVDNPHTKPFAFWEWLIDEVKHEYPEAIFLSEAFTRPHKLAYLAKAGFQQSYSYFAWRNSKEELQRYFEELTGTEVREYLRPNLWPNTPDILPEILQLGARSAFAQRFILASTLGANYGIYGPAFELSESRAREPGSEEYLDSEKYQLRHWDLGHPDSLKPVIRRMNKIRRDNPALQRDHTLRFVHVENEALIAYCKTAPVTNERTGESDQNIIVVVVNLDPYHRHAGILDLPIHELGIDPEESYQVHDLLSDARYLWHGWRNYVEIEPGAMPAHVFKILRRTRSERDFDYFA